MKIVALKNLAFFAFLLFNFFAFSQTTIIAGDDSYTWDTNPNGNYGDKRLIASTDTDNTSHNRDIYLKFNLSTISVVNSAKIVLNLESSISPARSYSAFLVNDSWTNGGIRWNNAPAVIGSSIASGVHVGNLIEFDITSQVASHVAGSDNIISIKIVSTQEDVLNLIYSTDTAPSNAEKPRLIVDTVLSLNDEINFNKVSVFPNPVINTVYINGLSNTDTTVSVYNTLGQLLIQQKYSDKLDLNTFKPGIYFMKVLNEFGQKTFRIVKK